MPSPSVINDEQSYRARRHCSIIHLVHTLSSHTPSSMSCCRSTSSSSSTSCCQQQSTPGASSCCQRQTVPEPSPSSASPCCRGGSCASAAAPPSSTTTITPPVPATPEELEANRTAECPSSTEQAGRASQCRGCPGQLLCQSLGSPDPGIAHTHTHTRSRSSYLFCF